MPLFTPLTLIALADAPQVTLELKTAVSAEDAAKLKTTPTPPGAELADNKDGLFSPCYGGFPVDAMYNFGSIRDLFAMRHNF